MIHYLQNKYSLLINGDIAEIAIAMSYMLFIILYYQVFRLGEKEGSRVLVRSDLPDLATLGSRSY